MSILNLFLFVTLFFFVVAFFVVALFFMMLRDQFLQCLNSHFVNGKALDLNVVAVPAIGADVKRQVACCSVKPYRSIGSAVDTVAGLLDGKLCFFGKRLRYAIIDDVDDTADRTTAVQEC